MKNANGGIDEKTKRPKDKETKRPKEAKTKKYMTLNQNGIPPPPKSGEKKGVRYVTDPAPLKLLMSQKERF